MPGNKLRQLFGLNIGEVSLVDAPAVPKAKLVLLKQMVSDDDSEASLLPLVKAATGRLAAIRSALKTAGTWDELDDAVKADFARMDADLQTTSTAMHAIDGVEKFFDEFDNVDSDAILLSDVNWASNMLISVKGTFDRLGERVGEAANEIMGKLNTNTLASIKDAAGLMVAVVEGIESAQPDSSDDGDNAGEDTTKKDETVPPEEGKTDEEVTEVAVTDGDDDPTIKDVLAALTGIGSKVDDALSRLTILETTEDDGSGDTEPDSPVADADNDETPNGGSDDDGETVGMPTLAQVEEGLALYPTMEPDEQSAFMEMAHAVLQHEGIPPDDLAASLVANQNGEGGDEAAAA
tara:strand:+ start:363 stop:1412 length:1050 start_codon:yes stop_codon:yes gene_type:complete